MLRFYKFVETVNFTAEHVMMDTGILFVLKYFPEIFFPVIDSDEALRRQLV